MSETFRETKVAFHELRTALRGADDDTRWAFAFWVFGITAMAIAIIGEFGWGGALFCLGLVVYAAGNHALTKAPKAGDRG